MLKKVMLLAALAVSSISVGQSDYITMELQVQNGKKQNVPVKFSISSTDAPFTLEDAKNNFILRMEREGITDTPDDLERLLTGRLNILSTMTRIMKIKNKPSWIPAGVYLRWDTKTEKYEGLLTGYARNGYNVEKEVKFLITMDSEMSFNLQ